MRHEVPQFIDIEDKIFGPLTFRQAIYLAGSVGAAFAVFYAIGKFVPFDIPTAIKVALVSPFVAVGIAMAFVRVNKRPFINYVEAAFYYFINAKRYIWKKKDKKSENRQRVALEDAPVTVNQSYVPKVSRSKLKDLAWSLDMELDDEQ